MAEPRRSGRVSAGLRGRSGRSNPFDSVGADLAESQSSPLSIPLKVLELLGRPSSAVSGFAAGIQKGDVGKAFENVGDALSGDKIFQFKDVLKRAGVGTLGSVDLPFVGKTTGRGVLGFGFDVLLDPLTYTGISTFTSAAKSGRAIRSFSTAQRESILKINKSFGDSLLSRTDALLGKAAREVTSEFDTGVIAAREAFEETGQIPFELSEYASLGQTTDKAGDVVENVVRNEANMLRRTAVKKANLKEAIDKDMVPNWIASWQQSAKQQFGPELKDVQSVIRANDMLDLAVQSNSQMDILRVVADKAPGNKHIGSSFAAQTQKGFRSTFTFMGLSPAQVAESLKLPPITSKALNAADVQVQRSVDRAFGRLKEWPVYQQLRKVLNTKATGVKEIDEHLIHYKNEELHLARTSFINSIEVMSNQMLVEKGKNPQQIKDIFSEVGKLMEWDNPNSILREPMPGQFSPESVEISLQLRKKLDETIGPENVAGRALGLSTTYLKGYFPRNISTEVKEVFDSVFSNDAIKERIFLNAGMERKGSFASLTTEEINTLLREDKLGLDVIEKGLQKDRSLMQKLRRVDPEIADFFSEDPAQAVAARLAASARVTSNRQFIAKTFELFGRRVTSKAAGRQSGEVLVVSTALSQAFASKELANPGQIRAAVRKSLGLAANSKSEKVEEIMEAFKTMRTDDLMNVGKMANGTADATTGSAMKLMTQLDSSNPHLLAALEDLGAPVYLMDKQIVDHIDNAWTMRRDGFGLSKIGRLYDGITAVWKKHTLAIFPEFHSRNFLSDVLWQNHLAGVTNAKEVFSKNGAYPISLKILDNTSLGLRKGKGGIRNLPKEAANVQQASASLKITADDGTVLNGAQMWTEFVRTGNVGSTFFSAETKGVSAATELTLRQKLGGKEVGQVIPNRANPLKNSFLPIAIGGKVGDFTQTWARLAHFIAKRKAGFTPDEAAMSVKKFLFDYDDLTHFEKKTMKRVFPFYTFMRKNLPLQLEQLAKQPGKFANLQKAIRAVEDPEVREDIPPGGIPDFVKREFGIVAKQEGDNVSFLLLGSFVPAADLVRFGDLSSILHTGAKSLSPLIQTPIEVGFKTNIFSGMQIEEFPGAKGTFLGQTMDKTTINLARKIRLLSTVDRVAFKEDPKNPFRKKGFSVAERLLDVGVGVRPVKIDVKKSAEFQQRAAGRISSKLNRALKLARRNGDEASIEFLNDLIEESKIDR